MILVIAEQRDGKLNRATLGNHRRRAAGRAARSKIAVLGSGVDARRERARGRRRRRRSSSSTIRRWPTTRPTASCWRSQQLIERRAARARVPAAHLPDARFRAGAGRARSAGRSSPTASAIKGRRRRRYVRPMFQGKLQADVVVDGPAPHLVDVPDRRVPRRRGDDGRRAGAGRARPPSPIDAVGDPPEARGAVPGSEAGGRSSQAERIVAVGRGIKGQEHLQIAEQLAEALGAEIAASRPICDAGWLPMDRQIGSSGQTVAPKLYVALGISGAIQHLVGMKGVAHDRRDQQGSRGADLRDRRLRHRRRPVRDRARRMIAELNKARWPCKRETLEVDVLIVGGGPAGMSAALRLAQLQKAKGGEPLAIAVLEKAREAGAHMLSGARARSLGAARSRARTSRRRGRRSPPRCTTTTSTS